MTGGFVLKPGSFDYKTGSFVFKAADFDIKTRRSDLMTSSFVSVTNRPVPKTGISGNKNSGFDMKLCGFVFGADAFVPADNTIVRMTESIAFMKSSASNHTRSQILDETDRRSKATVIILHS